MNLRIKPAATLTSSTSMSVRGNNQFERHSRNIWSLVKENDNSTRFNNTPDTSRLIETILNDNSLRFRDKLKTVKQRMKCSTKTWVPRWVTFVSQQKLKNER